MAKFPTPQHISPTLEDLFHLEDEELILVVQGKTLDETLLTHVQSCEACHTRLLQAQDALSLEPLHRNSDPQRIQRLMDTLTQAHVIPEPSIHPHGYVRMVFEGSAIRILETDTQVRIGPAVATRNAGVQNGTPAGVTFFRQLGQINVEIHLVRVPQGNFHLVVGVAAEGNQEGLRVILRRGRRELATMPVPEGTAIFKDLNPGRGPYVLDIQRDGLRLGSIDLDVSAHDEVIP